MQVKSYLRNAACMGSKNTLIFNVSFRLELESEHWCKSNGYTTLQTVSLPSSQLGLNTSTVILEEDEILDSDTVLYCTNCMFNAV